MIIGILAVAMLAGGCAAAAALVSGSSVLAALAVYSGAGTLAALAVAGGALRGRRAVSPASHARPDAVARP